MRLSLFLLLAPSVECFLIAQPLVVLGVRVSASMISSTLLLLATESKNKGDNKAMAFLRARGKVGGATAQDFINAIGVDEGPSSKSNNNFGSKRLVMKRAPSSFKSCVESGVIDDMTEVFPFTSSGTCWAGVTDRAVGGASSGSVTREEVAGKSANVLRGTVKPSRRGGYLQMTTDLARACDSDRFVDASEYDGIEVDVYFEDNQDEECNLGIHLKTKDTSKSFCSYRGTFMVTKNKWEKVRLQWNEFHGKGEQAEANKFDPSALTRIGLVARTSNNQDENKSSSFSLASAGCRFYKN